MIAGPVDGRLRRDAVRRAAIRTASSPRPASAARSTPTSTATIVPTRSARSTAAGPARSGGCARREEIALARRTTRGTSPRTCAGLQLTLRTGNGEPGPFDEPGSGSDPVEASCPRRDRRACTQRFDALGDPARLRRLRPRHAHLAVLGARRSCSTLPDLMARLDVGRPRRPARASPSPRSRPPTTSTAGRSRPIGRISPSAGSRTPACRGFTFSEPGEVTTPPRYRFARVKVGSVARARAATSRRPAPRGPRPVRITRAAERAAARAHHAARRATASRRSELGTATAPVRRGSLPALS